MFFGEFFLVTFLIKKLFLIIIKTHVSETSIYSCVPKRMMITFHKVKNGAEIIFFI